MSIPFLSPPLAVVPGPIYVSVKEVAKARGISRHLVMAEVAAGNIDSVRLGRRVFLIRRSAEDFFNGLPSAQK